MGHFVFDQPARGLLGSTRSQDSKIGEMLMRKDHCNEGLDNRCRDNNGTIREKRGDTLARNLRKTHSEEFAPSVLF